MMRRRALLAAAAALPFAPAAAQTFPQQRDIRLIAGAPPGGTVDLFARLLAERLGPVLARTVVVENRAGAGGLIAAEAVSRMAPDGHTISTTAMGTYTVLPQLPGQRMPIDMDRDLTALSNGVGVHFLLVTGTEAPFRTVADVIAAAKANPGKLTYASGGNGSSQHLAAELFKQSAGVDLLHVPYRGGAPAVIDMMARRVDVMFGNLPDFIGQLRGGGLRAIAACGERPIPLFPDLPLVSRDVPGYAVSNWFGLAGPKDMPAPVVQAWTTALLKVRDDPEYRRRIEENGMEVLLGTPEEKRATIARDRQRWGEVIRRAGIRVD